jgi:hypothetical protein
MVCSPVFYPAKFEKKGKLTTSLFGIFLRQLLVVIISRMRYRWPKMRCSPVWTFIVKRIGLYLHPVNAKRVRS